MNKSRYAAVAALFAVALAACGSDAVAEGQPPTDKVWEEKEWEVTTPPGWTRKDITTNAEKRAIRYRHADGSYVVIVIDPLGSGYSSYDTLWRYEVEGDGFIVAEKSNCTSRTDEACDTDNDRFDGYVLWETGSEPEKVGGHTFVFMFGDTDSTSIDEDVFVDIIESVRAA